MACCIFGALIIGNVVMMWRAIFGERSAANAASSWRLGVSGTATVEAPKPRAKRGLKLAAAAVALAALIGFTAGTVSAVTGGGLSISALATRVMCNPWRQLSPTSSRPTAATVVSRRLGSDPPRRILVTQAAE